MDFGWVGVDVDGAWENGSITVPTGTELAISGGFLNIRGGALILLGGWCMLLEFLIQVTFEIPMKWWSLYPMTALGLLGILMIIIGVNKPLRKSLHKKLFV